MPCRRRVARRLHGGVAKVGEVGIPRMDGPDDFPVDHVERVWMTVLKSATRAEDMTIIG